MTDAEKLAGVRELAESCALVSPKDLLAVLDGDETPLAQARWLMELCERCGHKRRSHNGYGGYARHPHCEIIGIKKLTWRQERANKDDTLYCSCAVHYEKVVAAPEVAAK